MSMKNKRSKASLRVKYSDEPIKAHVVRDFLPSHESLLLKRKKKSDSNSI